MLEPLIFSAIGFIAVVMLCIVIFMFWSNKQTKKEQNIRFENALSQTVSSEFNANLSLSNNPDEVRLRKDYTISSIPWLNTLLEKFLKDYNKVLIGLIEQTGLKIKVGEFVLFACLLGFIGALIVNCIFKIPFVGFILVIVPYFALSIFREIRIGKFIQQMPQALDLLSGDLRAGLDVQAALKHLSEEFPAPIGDEFGKVVVELNLGLSLNDALDNLAKRINTMDVQILCTGIVINRELGGNLSELTKSIADTVRERFRLKGIIKALTAENQGSAILLMVLPIGLYIILNMLAPATYNSFASDPIGKMILFGCVVSMTFGYIVIQKITKLEV